MIYALTDREQAHADRFAIATAIQNCNAAVILNWVQNGTIVHVAAATNGPLYCIYCCNDVQPTLSRPPRGFQAADAWHFEHITKGSCVGHLRAPPNANALGIENPSGHGCYVLLGCEAVPGRSRVDCRTIQAGSTYCHLARMMTPPCI